MKRVILFLLITIISQSVTAQNVGIGTTTPNANALLHIDLGTSTTKGLLINGTYNAASTIPDLGAGSRMMFYPGKAAFRAGFAFGTEWNNVNVGLYSFATGYRTTASGNSATAMGNSTIAGGLYSVAMGWNTIASGDNSTALGYRTFATGINSTAMGTKLNTYDKIGAFMIGDSDPTNTLTSVLLAAMADQFTGRFYNGYYLLTSGTGFPAAGVQIAHNGNAWVSICDKNQKENFEPLSGEDVLNKISRINFTSWNYKMQDAKIYRHYGVMAQDFYNAFGHDTYGTIGNDTTVNPIDMIGIDMAAIQALEKRTNELKKEITEIKNQNAILNKKLAEVNELKKDNENLKESVTQLQYQFNQQQKLIVQSLDKLNSLTITKTIKETIAIK